MIHGAGMALTARPSVPVHVPASMTSLLLGVYVVRVEVLLVSFSIEDLVRYWKGIRLRPRIQ